MKTISLSVAVIALSLTGCIPSRQARIEEAQAKEQAARILEHMDRGASEAMMKFSIPQKADRKRTPLKSEMY